MQKRLEEARRGKWVSSVVIGVLLGSAVSAGAPQLANASTAESVLDAGTVADLIQFWEENEVAEEALEALVVAMAEGTEPLSLQSQIVPVDVSIGDVGGFHRTTETFSDGSIRIAEVQIEAGVVPDPLDFTDEPTQDMTLLAAPTTKVSNCSIQSGSGYSNFNNCLVRGTTGAVSNWFYASWTFVQGAYNDQLRSTLNPGRTCNWPYTVCDLPVRSQYKSKETSASGAGATYTGSASTPFSTQTTYLNLEIRNNKSRAWFVMP